MSNLSLITMPYYLDMRSLACAVLAFAFVVCVASGVDDNNRCHANKYIYEPDAQARFSLMISLTKDETVSASGQKTCTIISRESLQNVLAAEWLVDRLNGANNGTGYVPGFKLGFDNFDDCRSPVFASRNTLEFVDPWLPNEVLKCAPGLNHSVHMGIVGPSRSNTASRVASVYRDLKMPIVSWSATMAGLSNKTQYPTFLRTVASDVHKMTMIVEILKKLHWSYVVVIYEDDEYGSSAAENLSELAKERGICIHSRLPLPYQVFNKLTKQLGDILKTAKDNSLGVVFIGGRDQAEQFMWDIDSNLLNKYGVHFIFTDAINTDVSIFDIIPFGQGTLTIAPSGLIMKDLHSYLENMFEKLKSGKINHPLVDKHNKDLFVGKAHNSFIPLLLHAIFALVEAFRLEHKTACKKMTGNCDALEKNIENGELLSTLFNLELNYKTVARGIAPDIFLDKNFILSFDENGDIKPLNNISAYTLYQYQKDSKQYKQIGTYIDGVIDIQLQSINMLTPTGMVSKSIPSSVCSDRCDNCLDQGKIPIVYMEGDAYILGVFSIHDLGNIDPFQCGAYRSIASDAIAVEGFLYAIKDLHAKTGIKFGAIAIDDCYSPLRTTSILSDFFSGIVDTDSLLFPFHIPRDKLVGVIACRSSGCTIPTASFFMPLKIPVVSYAASSTDLDDKVNYPYFLRTVPSDLTQAGVMLKIVKAMEWEYVGLLYVKNNYGTKCMQAFKDQAGKDGSGVCAAQEIGISEGATDMDMKEFFKTWEVLHYQKVKVVIFFGIDTRYRAFLKYLEDHLRYGQFIFLGTEEWGTNQGILESGPKSARGSITLKLQNVGMESKGDFKQHLKNKKPSFDDPNIWFGEYWQILFQCNFKEGFINKFDKYCDKNLKLSDEIIDNLVQEQRIVHTISAVYALGRGIKAAKDELCEDTFPCKFLRQYAEKVLEKIKNQKRREGTLDFRVFDDDGNGDIGFDVYNVQQADNKLSYVPVGAFNGKEQTLKTQLLKFYSSTGNEHDKIESKCIENRCSHCPIMPVIGPVTMEEESVITDFRVSDILIISLIVVLILAILVAVAVLFICCWRKYDALSKKLDTRDEQIYAEADHHVYHGDYMHTHGLTFVNINKDDPYRMDGSDEDNNNNTSAAHVVQNGRRPADHRGFSNPTFIHDHANSPDTVSFGSQPDFRRRSSGRMSRFSAPSGHNSSRALTTSYIRENCSLVNAHDNPVCVASAGSNAILAGAMPETSLGSSNTNSSGHPSGMSNTRKTPPVSLSQSGSTETISVMNDGIAVAIPTSQLHMPMAQSAYASGGEGLVYYMEGSDGQLSAHLSPPIVLPQTSDRRTGAPVYVHQDSVESDTSLTVNPDFGIYSLALANKQQAQINAPHYLSSNAVENPKIKDAVTPEGIELKEMNHNSYITLQQSCVARRLSEPSVEHSPIHYASVTHYSELQQQQYLQDEQHE